MAWLREGSAQTRADMFFALNFEIDLLMFFGLFLGQICFLLLVSICDEFLCFVHHLFRARILHYVFNDLGIDFGINLNVFSIPFCSLTQPAKPSRTIFFTMLLNDFTIQNNMMLDDVHYLFRYLFGH